MKVAVAGLGFMGLTHARAWKQVAAAQEADVILAGAITASREKREGRFPDRGGNLGLPEDPLDLTGLKMFTSLKECLEDREIDCVDICLPTDQHVDAATAALRAGKHVLLEKPMALDSEQAGRLLAEAERAGTAFMVAHVLRFLPEYRAAAELLRSGRLGRLRHGFLRRACGTPAWSAWLTRTEQSGGALTDLLIHDLDWGVSLLGKPEFISARGVCDMASGIDAGDIRLEFADGSAIGVSGGWLHPKAFPFRMEFTLVADEGTLNYSSKDEPLTRIGTDGQASEVAIDKYDGFQAELQYFAECVNRGVRPEQCPPEESALAVRLAELAKLSRKRNGERMAC